MNEFQAAATSRRRVLAIAGAAGASALLAEAMRGAAPASAAPVRHGRQLPPGSGAGKSVVILGAGIAGLTAAYELNAAGYDVLVVEAQRRAGGRSLTVRRGDTVSELSAKGGLVTQTCGFDKGLYLNLGPGRLPHHHRRVLRYCHELGVALEPYLPETTANLVQTPDGFGGDPRLNRQVANDTRGHLAALLSKAIRKGALSAELPGAQRDAALDLLREFGRLDASGAYAGSDRCGYAAPITVHSGLPPRRPLALADLLGSRFWQHMFYQPVDMLWQHTMFQPVGGMDMIVKAFVREVGHLVQYGAPVTKIRVADKSVTVTWRRGERTYSKTADYCLSNIPLPVLQDIDTNFAKDFDDAVNFGRFAPTCKVGWQANTRFWEGDRYEIYGGISRIDHNITQMWYPSYDYFSAKGTMTGAYNYDANAVRMGNLPHAERLKLAKEGGARLHPEMRDEKIVPTALGMSIAWHKIPYQLGGWAHWEDDEENRKAYGRLLSPDRRFHVIGDQVSPLDGWHEGAMMSAEHVLDQVAGIAPKTERAVAHAPDSRSLTQGGSARR